jgi:hypothetical protein
MTIADLLQVMLTTKGKLTGRVLTESLRRHADESLPEVIRRIESSEPAANSLRTLLRSQTVDGHTYFDAAGFAGRTAGLEVP